MMILKNLICIRKFENIQHKRFKSYRNLVSRMFPILNQSEENYKSQKANSDTKCKSINLMLSNKLIYGGIAGTYMTLPALSRAHDKLCSIVNKEMRSIGAQKIRTPYLTAASSWKRTGRYDEMGEELLTLKDRHGVESVLSPTHEEDITEMLASQTNLSQKMLPLKLYQIGTKFRDEMRPKNGLLRGREFDMKDMYSFDRDEACAINTYEEVSEAYSRIFKTLNLPVIKVLANAGTMGGSLSHEYQLFNEIGEDTLLLCNRCETAINEEINGENNRECIKCSELLEKREGIEIAHTFLLGHKYSKVFKATYKDSNQKKQLLYMGCYGIGISRLLAASVESLSTEDQLRWPQAIAPYKYCIIPQKKGFKSDITDELGDQLYDDIDLLDTDNCLLDDRTNLTIGRRMNLAKQSGIPYIIVIGKMGLESRPKIEFIDVYNKKTEYLTRDETNNRINLYK